MCRRCFAIIVFRESSLEIIRTTDVDPSAFRALEEVHVVHKGDMVAAEWAGHSTCMC